MTNFTIKKTPSGGFNFSLTASNGEKLVTASQVYSSKASCKAGVESVIKTSAKCIAEGKIEDQTLKNPEAKTCPKFEVYVDKKGLFRFRLIASNGECIAMCEDSYKSKSGCISGTKSVATASANAEIIDETK